MRLIMFGLVAGTCFAVLAVGALGVLDGISNPDGYPPGLFPGQPRSVAGCLWALAYFSWLAGPAGALTGGVVGGILAVVSGGSRPQYRSQRDTRAIA